MTKKRIPWTTDEDDFIFENYPVIRATGCAKTLTHRTIASIEQRANKIGVRVERHMSDVETAVPRMMAERQTIVEELMFLLSLMFNKNDPGYTRALRCILDAVKYQSLMWWYSRRHFKLGAFLEIFVTGYEWETEKQRINLKTIELCHSILDGSFEVTGVDAMVYAVNDL